MDTVVREFATLVLVFLVTIALAWSLAQLYFLAAGI